MTRDRFTVSNRFRDVVTVTVTVTVKLQGKEWSSRTSQDPVVCLGCNHSARMIPMKNEHISYQRSEQALALVSSDEEEDDG
jgi:hypothetical protein